LAARKGVCRGMALPAFPKKTQKVISWGLTKDFCPPTPDAGVVISFLDPPRP
jgi:hypothetical protein